MILFVQMLQRVNGALIKQSLEEQVRTILLIYVKYYHILMGRTIDPQKRKKYMEIMKNRLVKEFVIEVDKEIRKLEKKVPI